MITTEELENQIDETKLKYSPQSHGATVQGAPFVCHFEEIIDPGKFLDQITKVEKPWHFFGVTSKVHNGYWTCKGNLLHVEEDERIESSEVTLEVCEEWVRIYLYEESSAARVAEFVRVLDEKYGVEVEFSDMEETSRKPGDSQ